MGLLVFLDWLLTLPEDLSRQFNDFIVQHEEAKKMQEEYKVLLLRLQQKPNVVINPQQSPPENELLREFGKLAKVLIKKQVPQDYLRHKMQTTESSLKKNLFSDIVDLLDNFK